jgi:drug/metabolite transporter (DMT)-like permease
VSACANLGRDPGRLAVIEGARPRTASASPYAGFDAHPRSAALAAALGLSFTAIFFALSDASPVTATVYRCAYALPILWWLARREDRAAGPRPWKARRWAALAGVFFAIDLVLFHQSILLMGAGLASVMSNLQVVVVLLAAWLLWGERPSARQAIGIPIALVGIVLISGILDASAFGSDPVTGSLLGILVAISYAAYLLLIRKGRDLEHAAGPILDATLACALAALAAGAVSGELDLLPSLPGHVWLLLLALSAQVAGSVMIAVALPRLPAATTSLILLVQPVLAVFLAMLLLSEAPSPMQLLGVGLVVGGILLGSASRPSARPGVEVAGPGVAGGT